VEKLKKKDRIDFTYHFWVQKQDRPCFVESGDDADFFSCNYSSDNPNHYCCYSNNKSYACVNPLH
jgi:hypothetical protein